MDNLLIALGAAVMIALLFSVGAAVADDSSALIGEWLDNLPNGAHMITVFTATTNSRTARSVLRLVASRPSRTSIT